jgi:predicted Zn finger-like uncharacterized protein
VKFLCDRCKTRYSISDDRVRGKILKIRCKGCSNVITVREGMLAPEDDAAPELAGAGPEGARRSNKTTVAPDIQSESLADAEPAAAAAPGTALGAAFASAMAQPPPAIEQEWYVSIEGEQAGPFSLPDAQRWVASKPLDADLHCWSEGFDDWLPVDKVGHFRGLRKKTLPPVAPDVAPALPPRAILAAAPGAGPETLRAAALRGEVPKPMFASSMAQVERGATPANGLPTSGMAPGSGAAPLQAKAGLAPSVAGRGAAQPSQSSSSRLRAFDVEDDHGDEAATQLEPGLMVDAADAADAATQLEPAVQRAAAASAAGPMFPSAAPAAGPMFPSAAPAGPTFPGAAPAGGPTFPGAAPAGGPTFPGAGGAMFPSAEGGGDGDDLEIAEVSRVVKLTDLARDAARAAAAETAWPKPAPAPAPVEPPGIVAARAVVAARLEQLRPAAPEPAPGQLPGPPGEAPVQPVPELPPPPAASPKRGAVALISGAVVLVGVAVAVVFFVLTGEDEGRTRLGKVEEIDMTRPDEVRATGSGSGSATDAPNPLGPKPVKRPGSGGTAATMPTPTGPTDVPKLDAREIEEMAGKNASVTQRCYMRSQRGADGILIGDVKKIQVTLTISADGQVTDAQLSDNHAQNSLGKCLITAIKSWKFRPSSGGTFRFILHFG